MRDDELDALIDDTAKAMTERSVPASLHASIRQRVDAVGRVDALGRPFTGRRMMWRVGLLAGATAIVLLAVVTREGGEEPATTVTVAAPQRQVAPIPAPPASVPPVARASRVTRAAEQPAVMEAPPAVAASSLTIAADETAVVIEPLEIEPLAPVLLEPELIENPVPLRAERIDIEPIVIQ